MAPESLDAILHTKGLCLPAAVREWYILASRFEQDGLGVWIRARSLEACEGSIMVLTDTEGITEWGIRIADSGIEDPAVFSLDANLDGVEFPSFSGFVAAMIINDVLFGTGAHGDPVELDYEMVQHALTCLVASNCGDFFIDTPLESAEVVAFAYPGGGPVKGKARCPAGRALLERLRLQSG